MSYLINSDGEPIAEEYDGFSAPVDYDFKSVNNWVHGIDVNFEDLQCVCLGMANEIDKLRAKLQALENVKLLKSEV